MSSAADRAAGWGALRRLTEPAAYLRVHRSGSVEIVRLAKDGPRTIGAVPARIAADWVRAGLMRTVGGVPGLVRYWTATGPAFSAARDWRPQRTVAEAPSAEEPMDLVEPRRPAHWRNLYEVEEDSRAFRVVTAQKRAPVGPPVADRAAAEARAAALNAHARAEHVCGCGMIFIPRTQLQTRCDLCG